MPASVRLHQYSKAQLHGLSRKHYAGCAPNAAVADCSCRRKKRGKQKRSTSLCSMLYGRQRCSHSPALDFYPPLVQFPIHHSITTPFPPLAPSGPSRLGLSSSCGSGSLRRGLSTRPAPPWRWLLFPLSTEALLCQEFCFVALGAPAVGG